MGSYLVVEELGLDLSGLERSVNSDRTSSGSRRE